MLPHKANATKTAIKITFFLFISSAPQNNGFINIPSAFNAQQY
jgi:hypothetical protein